MSNEQELRALHLSNNEIKKLWPVLSNKDQRKECIHQLRKQGVYVIVATGEAPVYDRGVKRQIFICHTLGYFNSCAPWLCDDVPSVDERKQMYQEIERDLCTLVMEHGGIILSVYDDEPEELEDDEEDNFEEFSVVECEFPSQADADTASQGILDMWADFGVDVFDKSGTLIKRREASSASFDSELPSAARTNKSPQQRVPTRLVRAYGNLVGQRQVRRFPQHAEASTSLQSQHMVLFRELGAVQLAGEKEDVLAKAQQCEEAGDESTEEDYRLSVAWWCRRRDLLFNFANIAWLEAGLPLDPTIEQLDEWLGGNKLHTVRP